MHIHAQKGDKEMKIEIEDEQRSQKNNKGTFIVLFKTVKGCKVFDSKEKNEICLLINTFREDLVKKWNLVFVEGKAVKPIKINKKLKKETFLNKWFIL
jgi:hypothetical protein